MLPRLQTSYPQLRLEVRETQTKMLLEELAGGNLDAVMLALPADGADVETLRLFDDPFLLALPAADPLQGRVAAEDVDQRRLILLEEGHCLGYQALAFCAAARGDTPATLGATSLATVMQMVANGYGATPVPEVAAAAEVRDSRVKLLRFVEPCSRRARYRARRAAHPRRASRISRRWARSSLQRSA